MAPVASASASSASGYPHHLDRIRCREYPQLDSTVYLDHAGTTLYARSLVDRFADDMKRHLFGNPHSASPSSRLSSERLDKVRAQVLHYVDADPDRFDVVFVANATAAIKLVVQSFQERGFWYGFHKDAHTSLVGARELARAGSRCFVTVDEVDRWIDGLHGPRQDDDDDRADPSARQEAAKEDDGDDTLRLFAWPAQSNMTGNRLPLSWAGRVRAADHGQARRTYTLLDAASFLTTGHLDLSDADAAPDFVALSFYKIFGFPDLGALIVRKDAGPILRSRAYFGGGTVDMVIDVHDQWHAMRQTALHDALEDGTPPFHSIVALEHAFEVHQQLFGSPRLVSQHVSRLATHAYGELSRLRHATGGAVVDVHHDRYARYGDSATQGPIVAFSLRDARGCWIGKSRFEKLAIAAGFQIRTGGVCNAGGLATMLDLAPWEMRRNYSVGMTCGDHMDVLGGKPTGIVRISFGAMTSIHDVDRFVALVRTFMVQPAPAPAPSSLSLDSLALADEKGALSATASSERLPSLKTPPSALLTPIQGLPACKLPAPWSDGDDAAREALSVWDLAWRVVDDGTGTALTLESTDVHAWSLGVALDPERCVLSVSATMSKAPATPSEARDDVHERIEIDLLQSKAPVDPDTASSPRDAAVRAFFSRVFGRPCTLQRQKSPQSLRSSQEALTCVVSWCQRPCHSDAELQAHYLDHARHLERMTRAPKSRARWWAKIGAALTPCFT